MTSTGLLGGKGNVDTARPFEMLTGTNRLINRVPFAANASAMPSCANRAAARTTKALSAEFGNRSINTLEFRAARAWKGYRWPRSTPPTR